MRRFASFFLLVTASAFAMTGCAEEIGLPPAASEQGDTVGSVFDLYLVVAYAVGAIVAGLIIFVLWRDRASRRGDGDGSQRHNNLPLEVTYTVIPLLIVAALTTVTVMTIGDVDTQAADPDLRVEIEAYQWGWRFHYPESGVTVITPSDGGLPELVLPAPATIGFTGSSNDVIHSFWVPGFRFKRDIIPGRATEFSVATKEPAVYDGKCAEYCGLLHGEMEFTVRTLDEADFEAWIDEQGNTP